MLVLIVLLFDFMNTFNSLMHPIISISYEEPMTFSLLFVYLFCFVTGIVTSYFEHLSLSGPLHPGRAQVCSPDL